MPTFKDYIASLSSEAITSNTDSIPFLDTASGLIKRGTISTPSAWANFVPVLYWSGWGWATASVVSARYTIQGYLVYFEIHATVTSKGTCTWDFGIITYTSTSSVKYPLSWGVYASWGIISRWLPYEELGTIKFISSAPSTLLNWSAISVGDLILISGFYET